jgi:hypothetical protein
VPLYPALPLLFLAVYVLLLLGALWQQPGRTLLSLTVLVVVGLVARAVVTRPEPEASLP